jgi:hypothetical protein
MRKRWFWMVPLAILAIAVFTFVGGQIVMLLWNWLLPPLFGWHQITFWQALGLLVLCRVLFGGLGRHGHGGPFRHRMRDGCRRMSPEEREKFRQAMRERWEFGASGGQPAGQ